MEKRCALCNSTNTSVFLQQKNMELCKMCGTHMQMTSIPKPQMSPAELDFVRSSLFSAVAAQQLLSHSVEAAQLKTVAVNHE